MTNGSDLSELFSRDPVGLSDQNIDAIVARMRAAHAQFELGVKAPPKAAKAPKEKPNILKDLGLA